MIKSKLSKKRRIWMSEPEPESVVAINEEEMMQLMASAGGMGPGPAPPAGVGHRRPGCQAARAPNRSSRRRPYSGGGQARPSLLRLPGSSR